MPRKIHSQAAFVEKLSTTLPSEAVLDHVCDANPLPQPLSDWLGRLRLLKGVPFQYLVPDERMLPPESIRFFYLDMNWVDSLTDGAFSIGRNLTKDHSTTRMKMDRAALVPAKPKAEQSLKSVRPNALGLDPPDVTLQVVSGFLLRSSLVSAYKGMGANVFPKGGTPEDKEIKLLPILRFEALGEHSDTLLCLVDGDAFRVDIHEAPEQLHYGIDSYHNDGGKITAEKMIHTFEAGPPVKLSKKFKPLNLDNSFRSEAPRVLKMASLGQQIAKLNNIPDIDAAEMGFEMTEGVGMVSFTREP